jgi:NAD(P)H-dependent FMN reductase
MKLYQDKPQIALSTSPGGRGGAGVMKAVQEAANHFGGNITGSLSVGKFYGNFDSETGKLTDPDLAKSLHQAVLGLKAALEMDKQ